MSAPSGPTSGLGGLKHSSLVACSLLVLQQHTNMCVRARGVVVVVVCVSACMKLTVRARETHELAALLSMRFTLLCVPTRARKSMPAKPPSGTAHAHVR